MSPHLNLSHLIHQTITHLTSNTLFNKTGADEDVAITPDDSISFQVKTKVSDVKKRCEMMRYIKDTCTIISFIYSMIYHLFYHLMIYHLIICVLIFKKVDPTNQLPSHDYSTCLKLSSWGMRFIFICEMVNKIFVILFFHFTSHLISQLSQSKINNYLIN